MKDRKILIPVFIVIILSFIALTVITWPESIRDDEIELNNGRTLRQNVPIEDQVSDLNNDGEKNILDLILEINGGQYE